LASSYSYKTESFSERSHSLALNYVCFTVQMYSSQHVAPQKTGMDLAEDFNAQVKKNHEIFVFMFPGKMCHSLALSYCPHFCSLNILPGRHVGLRNDWILEGTLKQRLVHKTKMLHTQLVDDAYSNMKVARSRPPTALLPEE